MLGFGLAVDPGVTTKPAALIALNGLRQMLAHEGDGGAASGAGRTGKRIDTAQLWLGPLQPPRTDV